MGGWLRFFAVAAVLVTGILPAVAAGSAATLEFPPSLSSYSDPANASLWEVLAGRVRVEPFNLVATIVFFLAITHTFVAPVFLRLSHRLERKHRKRLEAQIVDPNGGSHDVSFSAEVFHFLGEVEAIFGIWIIPLVIALSLDKGWGAAREYIAHGVNFTEPMFVMVIMTIASSRPVLELSEKVMGWGAAFWRGSAAAWWLSILTLGPLLGSFITEPAAMTISALLLAERIYSLRPSPGLAYATLGLLFVNVSVGGTLTHFAAPPVLMVAGTWGWDFMHMLTHFGWKAVLGIVTANLLYLVWFRKEFRSMAHIAGGGSAELKHRAPVPVWITTVHVLFLAWTVFNNHYPALFLGGFLFYLAFTRATEPHQSVLALRPALLVGFFLAGLVVHGGLQRWWIGPTLSRLSELPLFFGAVVLTAFNDNAAITYLASLVPGFTDSLKHAVVAGAVVGGGLTVIANAPNPAGQSILAKFFPDGVSAGRLFLGALIPTAIMAAAFLMFR